MNERCERIAALAAACGLPAPEFERTSRGLRVTLAGATWYENASASRVRDADGRGILVILPGRSRGGWAGRPFAFLVAADEGHAFVRRVPATCRTVADAFAAITPAAGRAPGAVRQGDWFFTPVRNLPRAVAALEVRRDAPLGDTRHRADELITRTSVTNVTRYRVERSAREYDLTFDLDAAAVRRAEAQGWVAMPVDALLHDIVRLVRRRPVVRAVARTAYYVRGVVTAPDHAPVTLEGWHRAVPAPRRFPRQARDD